MISLSPASQPFGDPVPAGRAAEIVRGVKLMLADLGLASLSEVTLANGRRADVMALGPKGDIVIVEVKSCLQDFATDQKWPEYAPYCDRFYFAIDCDFPKQRIPEEAGLMVCDQFGGAILREAQPAPLLPARRKAVTLSFARLAAARLMRAGEPAPNVSEPAID
jgi:hypothetical protein